MAEGSATAAVKGALAGLESAADTPGEYDSPATASKEHNLAAHLSKRTPGISAMNTPISKTIAMLERPSSATPGEDPQPNVASELSARKADLARILGQVRSGFHCCTLNVLSLGALS